MMKRKKYWKNLISMQCLLLGCIVFSIIGPCFVYLIANKILKGDFTNAIGNLIGISVGVVLLTVFISFLFFLYMSIVVELKEEEILIHRYFSKKIIKRIPHESVNECIISTGSIEKKLNSGIYLLKNGRRVAYFEHNVRLAIELYKIWGEDKIRILPFDHREKIGTAYQVDFLSLSEKEQIKLLKYYLGHRYVRKTAEQILKKKK